MKFLENKGNIKVEEPAEQDNKPIVSLKQLNNQFIFAGNEDSSANFWHLGSLNIGQTVQREIFQFNFRNSSFNGIIDIVSEGYYGIALVGRYAILLNWLNFELLEAKEFDYDLTCIQKRSERFKYFIGDTSGQIIYLRLNSDTFQLEEDPEGSIRSKSQRNAHGHDKPIENLYLIKEKHQLVVASQDGIRLWDVKSKKLAANIEGEQKKPVTFIGYSKARLYVAGEDHLLRIYDLAGKLYRSLRFQYPIKCGVFLNSSELALSDGKNLKIINVISNEQDYYSVHKYNITHICRISDFQFVTADTKGSLYKWTLMSTESDPSLQYRVSLELSNSKQAHCSNFSPERITKFFSSNLSPQKASFHSQKFQQMKAKIEAQRNLSTQGIYEGSQKMVGDLYTQENYYLKAKVRDLESKVNASKGEFSESHRDFIQNSSFSRQNISLSQVSAGSKSVKDASSSVAMKQQKAQIKAMEQKLKEQEELVLKIQEEEQVLRNNAEKKVKQEKKAYMERNVDDIKLNSQRFESKIPLIQNDIDLLRQQLNFMNDRLTDRQHRIRDRSNSLQKKQSDIQQFHNEMQKRNQNVQEELNKKREHSKQLRENEKREREQLKNNQMKIGDTLVYEGREEGDDDEDEDENQNVHDDQIDMISQELDQTIKNSQNYINSQRNLNSSQQNRNLNPDESNDSNFKGSQVSSRNMNYRNDDINNSLGSSSNSCVLNNKKITSSTQARNIMKSNRDDNNVSNQENEHNINNSGRKGNHDISDIEEEDQDSYKYTNRRSSPTSNYANSQQLHSDRDSKTHKSDFNLKPTLLEQEEQNEEGIEENLKYSFIEIQFKNLQSQVKQLQQNYEELKQQQSLSPQSSAVYQQQLQQNQVIIPAQTNVLRSGEFKPILRIQQMSPVSLNSSQFANTSNSPTQLQSAVRLNNFIGQQQISQQIPNKIFSSPPPTAFTAVRSLSPNVLINNNSSLKSQVIQSTITNNLNNSSALVTNTNTSFYINNSPQRGYNPQQLQKSQIASSPGQILLLNSSLNQSQCEGLLSSAKQALPQITQSQIPAVVGSTTIQQKARTSSQLSQKPSQVDGNTASSNNLNQFNIFKQNSSTLDQSVNAQQNSQGNSFTKQSMDFIQQQKELLSQQQQQLRKSQNKIPPMSQSQLQNLQGQDNLENENEFSPIPQDRRVSSKLTNKYSKSSTPNNFDNDSTTNIKLGQYEQENEVLKKQLVEQSQLIKDLQVLMEKQKGDVQKRDEQIQLERENAIIQQQKYIEQCGVYEQNISKLSEQVMKQSEIINQLDLEKQNYSLQYSEALKQVDSDKNQLINQINQFEVEIQQKNADLIQNQNNLSQMNITLQQLRQMTTYEEVERLTKQVKVQESMMESLKNEIKSQKQLLIQQEKMIVDSKRIEGEFQPLQLQKQQLLNENDILKSRLQILESENKNLHQKIHTIREEIDGKYQQAILELQKLMQGQTNKQMNLTQSIENIKSGVLSGVDINALDKLIEMSNKKQQMQTTQNLKQSGTLVSSIPISQLQQTQQQRANNHQALRFSEQMSLSPISAHSRNEQFLFQANQSAFNNINNSGSSNNIYQKAFSFKNQNDLVNLESTSSIKTFNPDDQIHIEDPNLTGQGRYQSRSVSPLSLNNRSNNHGLLSSQQGKVLKSDRSQQRFDSESIRTFKPDGEMSVSNENSDSDYYSNFSNVQFVSQANSSLQRKTAFKNSKTNSKDISMNQKQVILVDEYENNKKQKEDPGVCSQQ